MSSTQKIRERIDAVLKELHELSTALDALDCKDSGSILRATMTKGAHRLLFAHMELSQLVTFVVMQWFPNWEPPCVDVPNLDLHVRGYAIHEKRRSPQLLSAMMEDIASKCAAILDQRAASNRNRRELNDLLLMLQAQLTLHSAYCLSARSHALEGPDAVHILRERRYS